MSVSLTYPLAESNTCVVTGKTCFQNAGVKTHEALRFWRKRARLSQEAVSQLFEPPISRAAVAQWETAKSQGGTVPEVDRLKVLAAAYGCSIDELIGGPGPTSLNEPPNVYPVPPSRIRLPLISWVSAGLRDDANDPYAKGNAEAWEDFEGPCSSISFCLRVRGASMTSPGGVEPNFPDGCIIGVDPRRQPKSFEFAVFRFNNTDEATFKQFVIDGQDVLLRPLNPAYPVNRLPEDAQLVGTVFEKRIVSRY